jgi:hypothetical protein
LRVCCKSHFFFFFKELLIFAEILGTNFRVII